jgi:hypothetical protein
LTSVSAFLWLILASRADYVGAAGGLLVVMGLVVGRGPDPGDFASRVIDRFEYAALAAVIPAAGWVSGVYGLAGGIHP